MPQFAFRLSDDQEHATVLSSATPVVVACRLTLGLFAFVGWCWGWGVGTKNFCRSLRGERRSSLDVTGFRPSRDTASLSLRGLPFLGPQSGAHQLSATATVRSAIFLFLLQVIRRPVAPIEFCRPRAPSGLELDPLHYLARSLVVLTALRKFTICLLGRASKVNK